MTFRRNSSRNSTTKKIDTPNVIPSKSTLKSITFRRNSSRNSTTKNRHAEGDCIKKHAKIDAFSSKFEQKFNHEKIDTPEVIASKITLKSTTFRRNSSRFCQRRMRFRKQISALIVRENVDRAPYCKSACVFEGRLSSITMTGL